MIDEAAFHRQVGGAEAMAAQIAQVIEMSKRPNVVVQLLPRSATVRIPAWTAPSPCWTSPARQSSPWSISRGRSGGRILTEPAKTATYIETFDLLRSDAARRRPPSAAFTRSPRRCGFPP